MARWALHWLFLVILPSTAWAEVVEIWSYAFVTMHDDEPISGYGAAIFKPLGDGMKGPMLDAERNEYEVEFSFEGPRARGKLGSREFGDIVVELKGDARVYEHKGYCYEIIRLFGGPSVNYVLLQRGFEGKCSGSDA